MQLLHLAAFGFAGEKQQDKSQKRPADHQTESSLVGSNVVHSDTVNRFAAPKTIQHKTDGGLQQGYTENDAHVGDSGNRTGQVGGHGFLGKCKTDDYAAGKKTAGQQ